MTRKIFIRFFIAFLTLISLNSRVFAIISSGDDPQKVKYVFYFIGDGMGLVQVNTTEAYLAALDGRIGLAHISFTEFPEVGTVSTFANNRLITCSAAAGTAMATGNKTNINRISMDPEGKNDFTSIATKAHDAGFKVGIITSVSIDHATPAVFYAHETDRDMYFEIGVDLTTSEFEYFAGGGFLIPDDTLGGQPVNLLQLAQDQDYQLVNTVESFKALAPGSGKALVLSPRKADGESLPFAMDMNPGDLTLADFTSKGIEMLENEKGFFMMVESGKIDWAGHSNDAAAVVHEVIAFDEAVKEALEFYEKHPDETLILITADHETGGMALGHGEMKYDSRTELLKYQKSSLEELNKIVDRFRVSKSGDPEADFNRILKVLENDLGLNSLQHGTLLSEKEMGELKEIFMASISGISTDKGTYGEQEPFMDAAVSIMNKKAGISWGTKSHTGVNVPIYAIGPGAELFSGYMDNTDIPKIIGEVMGVW